MTNDEQKHVELSRLIHEQQRIARELERRAADALCRIAVDLIDAQIRLQHGPDADALPGIIKSALREGSTEIVVEITLGAFPKIRATQKDLMGNELATVCSLDLKRVPVDPNGPAPTVQ